MANWTNETKDTSTFTNQGISGLANWGDTVATWGDTIFAWGDARSNWSNQTKSTVALSSLLLENAFYLLLEDGLSKLLLENSSDGTTQWTNQVKN